MPAPGPSDIVAGALDCEKLGLSSPHRRFSLSKVVHHFLEFGQQFGTAGFLGRAADGGLLGRERGRQWPFEPDCCLCRVEPDVQVDSWIFVDSHQQRVRIALKSCRQSGRYRSSGRLSRRLSLQGSLVPRPGGPAPWPTRSRCRHSPEFSPIV